MTKEARANVISWLAIIIVVGVCIYAIMHIVEKHQIEAQEKMAESVGDLGTINITVNGKTYEASVESNNSAKEFLNLLPMTLNMTDSNGNEKFAYMYSGISSNGIKTNKIEAGDVVLSGSSTVAIFYKDSKSSGKFIRLAHITNLEDLGSGNVTVGFSK